MEILKLRLRTLSSAPSALIPSFVLIVMFRRSEAFAMTDFAPVYAHPCSTVCVRVRAFFRMRS